MNGTSVFSVSVKGRNMRLHVDGLS